jgi:hypothetical protein
METFGLRRLGRGATAAAAFFAAGCASSDLSANAGIAEEVAECLPPGTPAPTATVRAIWFPYLDGFASSDTSTVHSVGVLVLAGNKLWFMAWNDPEHHFDMLHVVDFLPAEKVSVARMGTASMLVIQSGNDLFDSFELMNAGQFGSDPKVTQDLCASLQALRAKLP